jgi:predicted phage tail protein
VNATLVAAYAAVGVAYTDTLADIAYSVFSVDSATAGVPRFAALVKGRQCYDPRTGLTVWTDTPALCIADFVASQSYGKGEPVDYATVGAAADANDALIGGQKLRTLNLVIDTVSESRQWAETLRVYAGCWAIPGDAGVKLVADRPAISTSVFTFTASNIVAGSLKLRKRGLRDIPTVMEVSYTDTTLIPYAAKTATAYAPGVLSGATPRRESSISLPGITRYAQAYREAVERLNHFLLEDLDASWTAFDDALELEAGDVVMVTHPIGLTAKLMRLTAPPTSSAPGRWKITAREYDPAAYSDIVHAEPTYADTALPNPAAPPALTGLVVAEEVYQLDNGTYASRLAATWDAADYAYLAEYRVEVYQGAALVQSAPAYSATYRSPAVAEGVEYVVKVAAVTSIGAVGVWSQHNITPLGKYLIPGNVPSLTVFEAGGTVYGACQPAIDIAGAGRRAGSVAHWRGRPTPPRSQVPPRGQERAR